MEDIYDNLENYEDINGIHEIKVENKELKSKIEQYTATIDKLQRDFDKLAAEHKKLELNYSSLLKTAKAEIERKTQMIKELNIEKDKLIISARQNAIKNNSNNRIPIRDGTSNSGNSNTKKSSVSNVQEPSEEAISKTNNFKAYCKNDYVLPAQSIPNGIADANVSNDAGRNLFDRKSIQGTKDCTSKENNMQVLNKPHKGHNQTILKRISNRRKSMPVLSNEIKFSSDEDCENSVDLGANKKNYQPKEEFVKRFREKNYHNRMSETSSIENYSRHHEPYTGNYYRNKVNCNLSGEKYESSHRHREKCSPERPYYRRATEEYNQRCDYNRRRVYESPPCEKSYHKSRSKDRRSEYGRDRSGDFIRNRNDDDRYAEKHKLLDDYDEPSYKRQKFDHGYRHTQDYNRLQREVDCNKRIIHSPLELTEQLTCQSPDYVYPDYFISKAPLKEIKYTALEPLADPRLTSKKYKVITSGDREFLTTGYGKDLDFFKIGGNIVPKPRALLEPPEDLSVEFEKNVYRDITEQLSNNLGKQSDGDSHKNSNEKIDPPKLNRESVENKRLKCSQTSAVVHRKFVRQNLIKDGEIKTQTSNKICVNMGEISKIDENNRNSFVESDKDNVCNKTNKHVVKESVGTSEEILTQSEESNLPLTLNSMPQLNINPESSMVENKIEDNNMVEDNDNDRNKRNYVERQKHYEFDVSKKIVEDDLILSDETSDLLDTHQKSANENVIEKSKKKKDTKKCDKNASCTVSKSDKFVHKKEAVSEDEKASTRSHKGRKKSVQKKDPDSDKSKSSKTKKSKKEKDSKTHQIKSKFCDLFGDSSSLITPDDLGIVNHENEISNKYSTLFEDTQAAVDLNLKELEKHDTLKESCQGIQKDSAPEEVSIKLSSKAMSDSITTKDNKLEKDEKQKSNKILKNDSKTNPPVVKEMLNLDKNIRKISTEPSDVVKTIIISTGMQPQNLLEDNMDLTQPKNVVPFEKHTETLTLHALATSTPAKVIQESHTTTKTDEPVLPKLQDCSSSTTSNISKVLSAPTDQSSHSQMEDVPDVRIFVKRKRKLKRVTS